VLEVEVTPHASAQIQRAAAWWAENRLSAPDAIRTDFQEATRSWRASGPGFSGSFCAKQVERRYRRFVADVPHMAQRELD
jgi:hypothetical protein